MTTLRRTLALLALTVTVALAGIWRTAPAQAQFSDTVAGGVQLSTATVAAPGSVTGSLTCANPATMGVTWTASTTARVKNYVVTVYFSDGFVQKVELGATATSWSTTIAPYYVTAFSVQYSVTTVTDYGWTKESARTPAFRC